MIQWLDYAKRRSGRGASKQVAYGKWQASERIRMIPTAQESGLSQAEHTIASTNGNGTSPPINILKHPLLYSMTCDVLLEKTDVAYLARPLLWPYEIVMADTREEALEKARHIIHKHLSQSEVVSLSIETKSQHTIEDIPDSYEHPAAKFSGMFPEDDPYLDMVQEEIERYRDELDRELGAGKYMENDDDSLENLAEDNHEVQQVIE